MSLFTYHQFRVKCKAASGRHQIQLSTGVLATALEEMIYLFHTFSRDCWFVGRRDSKYRQRV